MRGKVDVRLVEDKHKTKRKLDDDRVLEDRTVVEIVPVLLGVIKDSEVGSLPVCTEFEPDVPGFCAIHENTML